MSELLNHPNVPRYVKLAERVGAQIRDGQLKPGDRLPSFAEMKAQMGVSQNTLERVHAVLEKQGLIVREQGRGTFVARQNSTRSKTLTGIIGVCGLGFSFRNYQAYWARLFQGVREAATQAGVHVLALDHASSDGWEKADGILISSWTPEKILERMPSFLPHVSMIVPIEGVCSVVIDERSGVRNAVEHLIERGHSRIGYLHSKVETLRPLRRIGYRDALLAAGIEARDEWQKQLISPYIEGQEFIESGRRTMREWLDSGWRETGCTALLTQNDETAIGAIETLQEAGLRVPDDVSVIGFDGTEICDYFKPRLTSVEIPLSQVGHRAAELLLQQIESGETLTHHEALLGQIAERETVFSLKIKE